jgi:CheY-like chemotaxis protein
MALLVSANAASPLQAPPPVDVLIAEDNEFARNILRSQLQILFDLHKVAAKIFTVGDGGNARRALCREGFEALTPTHSSRRHEEARKFMLAFMDCQMPDDPEGQIVEMEGILVAEDVRRAEGVAKSPRHVWIIANSADRDQSKFKEIFDAVLPKPTSMREVEVALVRLGIISL